MPNTSATREQVTEAQVTEANRRFYDRIAQVYDQVDSRRRGVQETPEWLDQVLSRLGQSIPTDAVFLDAGAGSGFLTRAAAARFKEVIALDVSQAMLDRIEGPGIRRLLGDCNQIPLPDASVDVVGAFATLHHLHSPEAFLAEALRVLRPGGILYTDHDIEAGFARRFRLPLLAWRAVFDHGHAYLDACPEAGREDYELSEFHGDAGLDGRKLVNKLHALGFIEAEARFHWEGMGPPARILGALRMQNLMSREGMAPVFRLLARKPRAGKP